MILITGANGFIGRRLYARMKAAGARIIPLYRAEQPELCDDLWALDLTQDAHLSLLKAMAPAPETVIHLAGYVEIALQADPRDPSTAPLPDKEDIARIYASNVSATANLLDFCLHAGVRHLIFASSQAVYGLPQREVLTEESPCAPLEHYAASKLCCEHLLHVGSRQGISTTILRLPGVFSEERTSGVVYRYCQMAIRSKKISPRAQFPLPLDVIHLDDVIGAFEKAVEHSEHKYLCLNIATGEPCSLDLLADAIAELVPGCKVEHSEVPQPVVQMDIQRAYAILGWKAQPRRVRLPSMLESVRNAV